MDRGGFLYREIFPFAAMIMVECINVGSSTIYKAASTKGLSYHVFLAYSFAIASLLLFPLSFIYHRKTPLPPVTLRLVAKFFVLALIGFTAQSLGYKGIAYSNPTLGSAMNNLTPALTFILAVIFRMEKLAFRSLSTQAKIVGILASIAGALVVVLYCGPVLIQMHAVQKPPEIMISLHLSTASSESNWLVGGGLLAAAYALISLWFIYQTKVVKEYPAKLVIVFFYSLVSCIIATIVGLIMEPNLSAWKVKPNVMLISILYTGIMETIVGLILLNWGLHLKGPVYATLFKPLSIAIAVSDIVNGRHYHERMAKVKKGKRNGITFTESNPITFGEVGNNLAIIFSKVKKGRITFGEVGDKLVSKVKSVQDYVHDFVYKLGHLFVFVIGSVTVSMGFYIVIWGRTKEEIIEELQEDTAESSSNSNVPLLKYHVVSIKSGHA